MTNILRPKSGTGFLGTGSYANINMRTCTGVILGQNCVRLSDAVLDIFFFENLFYRKQCKYGINIEVAQISGALYRFL